MLIVESSLCKPRLGLTWLNLPQPNPWFQTKTRNVYWATPVFRTVLFFAKTALWESKGVFWCKLLTANIFKMCSLQFEQLHPHFVAFTLFRYERDKIWIFQNGRIEQQKMKCALNPNTARNIWTSVYFRSKIRRILFRIDFINCDQNLLMKNWNIM